MGSVNAESAALAIDEALKTDVRTPLAADIVGQVLAAAPFVAVPGAFNVRDLSQPGPAGGEDDNPKLRKGFIYRSGVLTFIKDEGKAKLASDLGITTIFDLRMDHERKRMASPEIDGIETRWLAPAQAPQPTDITKFAGEDGGVMGLLDMYRDILVTHVPIYRTVFEHIRDHPEKPILFHCTGTVYTPPPTFYVDKSRSKLTHRE